MNGATAANTPVGEATWARLGVGPMLAAFSSLHLSASVSWKAAALQVEGCRSEVNQCRVTDSTPRLQEWGVLLPRLGTVPATCDAHKTPTTAEMVEGLRLEREALMQTAALMECGGVTSFSEASSLDSTPSCHEASSTLLESHSATFMDRNGPGPQKAAELRCLGFPREPAIPSEWSLWSPFVSSEEGGHFKA